MKRSLDPFRPLYHKKKKRMGSRNEKWIRERKSKRKTLKGVKIRRVQPTVNFFLLPSFSLFYFIPLYILLIFIHSPGSCIQHILFFCKVFRANSYTICVPSYSPGYNSFEYSSTKKKHSFAQRSLEPRAWVRNEGASYKKHASQDQDKRVAGWKRC